jgi:hypothetical protein
MKTELVKSKSSHIANDGQSISKSWCRSTSGVHGQILIALWQLRPCFRGTPSLTIGRFCLLYMLLALASVVVLGSESLGTRDHILLSQMWDFPFPRLLRLAGSRWRHSTPPPHGCTELVRQIFVKFSTDKFNKSLSANLICTLQWFFKCLKAE